MTDEFLAALLNSVADKQLSVEEAADQLRHLGTGMLGFARIDHLREARCGLPEVVYGAGKTAEQIVAIMRNYAEHRSNVLVTRLRPDAAPVILQHFPTATYDPVAATISHLLSEPTPRPGNVAVVAAGTSDQPVAMEAMQTLQFFGISARLFMDVGVAGIHRLLAHHRELQSFDVVIVVAGMEGALPSVVGGLVAAPVVAVPTSVGYGANLNGLTALLGMVNSCSSGITVTNIDNGYGAACAAARMVRLLAQKAPDSSPRDAVATSNPT